MEVLGDDSAASQAKLHCYLERLLFEVTSKHEPNRASVFVAIYPCRPQCTYNEQGSDISACQWITNR